MSREPKVPLTVFLTMMDKYHGLIRQEAAARREHEERIVNLLDAHLEKFSEIFRDALKPHILPEPAGHRLWKSEAEEDLDSITRFNDLSEEEIKLAISELGIDAEEIELDFN